MSEETKTMGEGTKEASDTKSSDEILAQLIIDILGLTLAVESASNKTLVGCVTGTAPEGGAYVGIFDMGANAMLEAIARSVRFKKSVDDGVSAVGDYMESRKRFARYVNDFFGKEATDGEGGSGEDE